MSWRKQPSPKKKRAAADKVNTIPTLSEGPSWDEWMGTKSPLTNATTPRKMHDQPIVVFQGGKTSVISRHPDTAEANNFQVDEIRYDKAPQFDGQDNEHGEPTAPGANPQSRHQHRRQRQWYT